MNHQPPNTNLNRIRFAVRWSAIAVGSLLLAGCKQPQIQPPIDAPIPPIPSPVPAPPSLPSPTPAPPSPPSAPSLPSPSDGPQSPTPPGSPPPGQDTADGPPSTDNVPPSRPGGREEAGDELEKAGQKVAKAGSGLPGRGKGREYVIRRVGESERDEAHDPLMLPSDGGDEGEDAGGESAGESAEAEGVDDPSGQTGDGSEGSTGAVEAQEAVAEAAEVLQRAGEVLRGAETEEDIARAAEILSDARIAVIVAGQVMNDAAAENPEHGDDYDEVQRVLSEANEAIVMAGQTIYGLPEYESVKDAFPGGEEGEDELDKELEESLEIFDRQIADARSTVLGDGGGLAKGGQGIPTGDIVLRGGGLPDELPPPEEESGSVGAKPDEGGLEDVPPNEPQAGGAPVIPEDIGDGQDDDIVAQQLREAAIAEKDPYLREKLWEEYRRYKSSF